MQSPVCTRNVLHKILKRVFFLLLEFDFLCVKNILFPLILKPSTSCSLYFITKFKTGGSQEKTQLPTSLILSITTWAGGAGRGFPLMRGQLGEEPLIENKRAMLSVAFPLEMKYQLPSLIQAFTYLLLQWCILGWDRI